MEASPAVDVPREQLFNNVSGLNTTERQDLTEAEAGVAIITFYLVLVSGSARIPQQ